MKVITTLTLHLSVQNKDNFHSKYLRNNTFLVQHIVGHYVGLD